MRKPGSTWDLFILFILFVYIIHLFGAHLVIFQHVMSVYWDHPMPPRIRAAVLSSFAWWCPLEELPATVERERKTDLFKLKRASGWWFGTFFIVPYIGNVIILTDFHIFQRGRLNHQPVILEVHVPVTLW